MAKRVDLTSHGGHRDSTGAADTTRDDLPQGGPLRVFYSYAHEDESLREELDKQLKLLERQKVITGWDDRDISGGSDWRSEIHQHLEAADIVLLLVSSDFLASDF